MIYIVSETELLSAWFNGTTNNDEAYVNILIQKLPTTSRNEHYVINSSYPTPMGMAFDITIEDTL